MEVAISDDFDSWSDSEHYASIEGSIDGTDDDILSGYYTGDEYLNEGLDGVNDHQATDSEDVSNNADITDIRDSGSKDSSDPNAEWSGPSVSDVLLARRYLLRLIPLELADVILEAGMYWPRISVKRNDYLVVAADYRNHDDAALFYVVTPSIPQCQRDSSVIPTKVRMVKFTFESHDQGWGGERRFNGTYLGSWTWFEAAIIRDDNPDIGQYLLALNTMNARELDELDKVRAVEVMKTSGVTSRWLVQRNIQVSSTFKQHEVVWINGDKFDSTLELEVHKKGQGTGEGFLNTLSAGDKVAVIARAQYPGWENHISSIKVDIYYSI